MKKEKGPELERLPGYRELAILLTGSRLLARHCHRIAVVQLDVVHDGIFPEARVHRCLIVQSRWYLRSLILARLIG